MYHTIIIDDDPLARKGLRHILEQNFEDVHIMGEADSVASGLALIHEFDPYLVFLDIEMPDGTGFRFLEQLPKVNFKVVFTTSYSDYAITAIKYSAFDYIVKPVSVDDVKSTINRIKEVPIWSEKQELKDGMHSGMSRKSNRCFSILIKKENLLVIIQLHSASFVNYSAKTTRFLIRAAETIFRMQL